MRIRHSGQLAGALALGLALLLGASQVAAKGSQGPTWITTKGKTVTLTLVAGYNTTASGFNFNGGAKGKMTITVPLGDTVNVTFSNKAPLPHSAQFVAFAKSPPMAAVSDAFKGANSPNPTTSATLMGKTQKFSFVANKAGNYLLICAVPGHAAAGMWDNFVVSKSAKAGSISMK